MSRLTLEEAARHLFGKDSQAIREWVDYWQRSPERNRELLERFSRLVPFNVTGKRVLDIGCGTGGSARVLQGRPELYVGADYHFHVLQFAQPDSNHHFLQCSGTRLPFRDERFHFILAFDVIEHLVGGLPWQTEFLRELRRVLHPLGMIFLTTPNWWHPREGHTGLWGPQFLPTPLADRYIARRQPSFLKEHRSFSEIRLLSPRTLRTLLRRSGLRFLHALPCGMDRLDFMRLFPLKGWLAALGLGWYPHAEFWGVLVRKETRRALRCKLLQRWVYEYRQPSPTGPADFSNVIDFNAGPFGYQLERGWYYHEMDRRGFRWTQRRAVCHLQTEEPVREVRVLGYTPWPNRVQLRVGGRGVGRWRLAEQSGFELIAPLPFRDTGRRLFKVQIDCARTHRPEQAEDHRRLGLMIFRVTFC